MSSKQWSELPIQNDPFDTSETIYLAFGNNFRYEPTGGGTKIISVVEGRGIVNPTKFQLTIIDAGEYPIEWASNIQWKTGSAPQFQQYHTDVLMFETENQGKTWVGEVTQSTAMTPYWKLSVIPMKYDWGSIEYTRESVEFFLPINADAIEYIDWGDGTVEEAPFDSESLKFIEEFNDYFNVHSYSYSQLYTITIKSTKFNTGYIITYDDNSYSISSDTFSSTIAPLKISIVEMINPLPTLKGSYQGKSSNSTISKVDNTLKDLLRKYNKLQTVADTFFRNNSSCPIGPMCFRGCNKFQSIPLNPFINDSNETDFSYSFDSCYGLRSIPVGLFDNNTAATSFNNCFSGCTSLESIPDGLFDNNTAATDFSNCFEYCTSLESIPDGLFDNNTAVTSFEYCFHGCRSLQFIPSGLFDNNTEVIDFTACFNSCSSLTSIPEGLFDNCIKVIRFGKGRSHYSEGCFESCTSLQSIPPNLFKKNVNVEYINCCFNSCSALNDFTIHIGSSLVTNCYEFVTKTENTVRTVYVPSNSTTQTKFNNVATSLGLTIIGE